MSRQTNAFLLAVHIESCSLNNIHCHLYSCFQSHEHKLCYQKSGEFQISDNTKLQKNFQKIVNLQCFPGFRSWTVQLLLATAQVRI